MSDRDLIARLAHALRVQLDGVNLYSELLAEADAHQNKPGGGAMSGDRLRELCAELVEALDAELDLFETRHSDLIDRARALLAEAQPVSPPEPVGNDLEGQVAQTLLAYASVDPQMGTRRILYESNFGAAARAILGALQRWGRPAPEPVSVATDAAWRKFIEAVQHAQHVAMREGECPPFDLVETAFALWRSAAPEPVSVAERMPTAADCDGWGRCWHWDPFVEHSCWVFMPPIDYPNGICTHWLPHWALPVPLPTTEQ